MTSSRLPAAAYVVGLDGPAVVLTGQACAWLEALTNLPQQRAALRGENPVVDEQLLAIRYAAHAQAPHEVPAAPVPAETVASSSSEVLVVDSAATLLGVSPRRVRQLTATGRLPADKSTGVWLIARTDLDKYREGGKTA